jgi:deoxyribodipyrimidine photo-lyase
MKKEVSIFWHRRDLRIDDNVGLCAACQSSHEVLPLFIFDTNILNQLEKNDARVQFIHQQVLILQTKYQEQGGSLQIMVGKPTEVFKTLNEQYQIKEVHANEDYEPYALERDENIRHYFNQYKTPFYLHKDHVIFHKHDVVKGNGEPYTIYTPYMKVWKNYLSKNLHLLNKSALPSNTKFITLHNSTPSLQDLGFVESNIVFPKQEINHEVLKKYHEQRDYPFVNGTSKLGLHLRFGTVSIRAITKIAIEQNETFLNELIWREFYQMIIFHFPYSATRSFKKKYDNIIWHNNENDFEKWCRGETGYPIVDAGMRELNHTGYMHNRVRMIVASFLCKHLLIDWKWGEAYFASKLLDYDLASNVGGWQWAAGCGCDAAPYFRVFSPELQTQKFDASHEYIKKWVPEYNTNQYPKPMVDHAYARNKAIETYKKAFAS